MKTEIPIPAVTKPDPDAHLTPLDRAMAKFTWRVATRIEREEREAREAAAQREGTEAA